MTKRTIETGVGSYVDPRGNHKFGFRGDEVDVNDDFLEEFDAINLKTGTGEPVEYERVGVNVVSPDVIEADRKTLEEQEAELAETQAKEAEGGDEEEEAPKSAPRKAAAKKAT